MHPLKIIINADDFGLSENFNKGILELIQDGIVTSTTVMIKRKFANCKKLRKVKNISTGLHLELKSCFSQKEIENQINSFIKIFNKKPSHLDGHQHCHLTKHNLPLIIKAAQKYNLPVRSNHEENRNFLRKFNIKTPDQFLSWHPSRKKDLFEKLANIKNGVTELVCHPRYFDKNCNYLYNKQREKELKILKSPSFQKTVHNYEKINYSIFKALE